MRQNETIFDREGEKTGENEEMSRVNLSPFPHSLSISSSFSHYLSIFSQPGWQAGTTCGALGCSTALYTADTVDTVDTVETVDTVDIVETVDTVTSA